MKKIYFIAINWDYYKKESGKIDYDCIKIIDKGEGEDIAQFADHFPYDGGWRLYAFTTKKSRDQLLHNTINGEK